MGRLTLHALSPTDGSRQWVTEYSESDFGRRLCLRSDIAVDDQRVYVPGCDGLRALRRSDGKQTWFVGSPLKQGVGVGNGQVYANAEDLLAIDADSGDAVWRANTGGDRLTTPAATTGGVIFTNRVDGAVTAFDVDGSPPHMEQRTYRELLKPAITYPMRTPNEIVIKSESTVTIPNRLK